MKIPHLFKRYMAHSFAVAHEAVIAIAAEERAHLVVALGLAALAVALLVLAAQVAVAAESAVEAVA